MIGLVYRTGANDRAPAWTIAGRPLVIRQIQFLRALGIERVVVEHAATIERAELEAWARDEALTSAVTLLATPEPLGLAEAAHRAGAEENETIVALPDTALVDADLRVTALSVPKGTLLVLEASPPAAAAGLAGASIAIGTAAATRNPGSRTERAPGWGVTVGSLADALEIGSAALAHELPGRDDDHLWPIQVHAAEDEPGVWVCRGVQIEPGAKLTPPVLLGEGAIVRAGAQVGPRATLGAGAVINRDASVSNAVVEAGTVVGEGICLETIGAAPHGLVDLVTGSRFPVDDPAILGPRHSALRVVASSRMLALALLVVVTAPAAVTAFLAFLRGGPLLAPVDRRRGRGAPLLDAAHERSPHGLWLRLVDVLLGRRTLVGVGRGAAPVGAVSSIGLRVDAARAAPGAILVDDALFGRTTDVACLRAAAWYGVAKSWRVDMDLLRRSFSAADTTEVGS